MQKLIAKYGAAAHLAILAVAPLFLSPFVEVQTVVVVLLWLSVPASLWIVLEPSLRGGEALHQARARVASAIFRDPAFWTMLLIVLFSGIRALNVGIGMAYDAELSKWYVRTASLPLFPGSVENAGRLPFAVAVALTVILVGCRHSLGRSARMSFLLVSSSLAGLAALVSILALAQGNALLGDEAGLSANHSFVGVAFGVYFLSGVIALVAAFERKWNLLVPLSFLSLGGTGAGAFVFAPAALVCAMAGAAIVLFAYVFFYLYKNLEASAKFKFLVVSGVALTLGGFAVAVLVPDPVLRAKLSPYVTLSFLDDEFFKVRAALSALAIKSWLPHIWIGTGLASFPFDFRFAAGASDWALANDGVRALANGWLLALVERGVIGLVVLLVPCGFLTATYFRRLVMGFGARNTPHPVCWLYPLTLVVLIMIGIVDCSILRADVLMVAGALWAISARGFPSVMR